MNQNYAHLKAQDQSFNEDYMILLDVYRQGIPDTTFHDYMHMMQDD